LMQSEALHTLASGHLSRPFFLSCQASDVAFCAGFWT
jgi:hypothetical protein